MPEDVINGYTFYWNKYAVLKDLEGDEAKVDNRG